MVERTLKMNENQNEAVEFEFDAAEDDSEEVCNISSQPAKIHIDNLKIVLKPGQRISVPKQYVRRHAMQPGRDPVASAIHMMTDGRVVPSSDPRVPKLQTPPRPTASQVVREAELAAAQAREQELQDAQERIRFLEAALSEREGVDA